MKYAFENGRMDITELNTFHNKTIGDFFDAFLQSRKNRYLLLHNKSILLNNIPVRNEEEVIRKRIPSPF